MNHIVWSAEDKEKVKVELHQNFDIDANKDRWTLEVTQDPFLGYPAIYLSFEDLLELREAIDNEIKVVHNKRASQDLQFKERR